MMYKSWLITHVSQTCCCFVGGGCKGHICSLIILHIHKHKDVDIDKVVTDLANVKDRRLSRTLPVKNLITIFSYFFLNVRVGRIL